MVLQVRGLPFVCFFLGVLYDVCGGVLGWWCVFFCLWLFG